MKNFLLQQRRMIFPITAVLGVLAWGAKPPLMAPSANLGAYHNYSVWNIQGNYAVVNHYGANVALGIGEAQFDGDGNLRGTLLLNSPTSAGTRQLTPLTFKGTYTVDSDGKGTIFLTVTLPDGTTKTATEDFVITRTERLHGVLVATGIIDEQREPSLVLGTGVFVTQEYTRRKQEWDD